MIPKDGFTPKYFIDFLRHRLWYFVLPFFLISMATKSQWQPLGYFIASLILFALAFIFWNLDKKRVFPIKRWGHGLWHLLTGAAIALLFYANSLVT